MNETQKTLIIVGLVLFLLVIALHLIFIEKIKNDLLQAEYDLKLEEFSEFLLPDADGRATGVDEIAALERKLDIYLVLRFSILVVGLAAFVTSYFFREKSLVSEFEDEWDDDEPEEDGKLDQFDFSR